MPSPIKLGVVGLSSKGWGASNLVPALIQPGIADQFSITAVSTTSATSAAESAQKWTEQQGYEVKAYHGDTSAISADDNVDLVLVTVKVTAHRDAVVPAIEAGKDVFVEWPLGRNYSEAVELAELVKSKGVRNIVGLQGWASPEAKKIKEIITSGKLGRVLSTTLVASTPGAVGYWAASLSEGAAYFADAKNGATMLDIMGGHILSVFTRALGDISSISATTKNQHPTSTILDASGKPTEKTIPNTNAHQVAFSGLLTSGAVYSIHLSAGSPKASSIVWIINGSEGTIRVEGDLAFIHAYPPKLVSLNGTEVVIDKDPLGNIGRTWYEFASGEQGDYPTFGDAVKIHAIIDAVHQSADGGRRVDLA